MQWRAAADQRVEERRCKEQAAQAPTNPQLSDRSRALASNRGWSHVDVADRLTAQGRLTAEKLERERQARHASEVALAARTARGTKAGRGGGAQLRSTAPHGQSQTRPQPLSQPQLRPQRPPNTFHGGDAAAALASAFQEPSRPQSRNLGHRSAPSDL